MQGTRTFTDKNLQKLTKVTELFSGPFQRLQTVKYKEK